jgi:sec1 family domain-containing protein 1
MVARKLNKMISEHPTLLRGKSSSHYRPLLVIMDRNSDLVTPVQHSSTYQALIDDLLSHNANRVEFQVSVGDDKRRKSVAKKYDLDPDADPFYSRQKFNPFPEAIESNGAELQEVTAREQAIRSKTGDTHNADPMANAGTNELANAVDSLPALLDRKKQLEVHTSILQAVMGEVASRAVPQFYELESGMSTGSYKSDLAKAKKDVLELVTDPGKGNVQDKVRLVLVYALATACKSTDLDEVATAMKTALETKGSAINSDGSQRGMLDKDARQQLQIGMQSINYIKQLRSMHMIVPVTESVAETNSSAMLSSFMKSATTQATGLLAKATEKMGSMLGKTHKHHATRVVENLCEMKPNTEDDDYLYLDPRVKGDVDVKALRNMNRAPVREIVAFMVGGGCYAEYQNLQMVANDRRTVSYGSTELVNPCQFMAQLGQLG